YADWCSDCQAVKPTYEEMPAKYQNITFVKIDIADENNIEITQEFGERYGIGNGDGKTIPDFKLFINGEYAYTGFLNTPEELEQYVEDVANGKIPDVENGQVP
ncbi:MAG: thioredoxin family protein, partial [Methanimicrococcus sp.]|nr:thioredoxin family protein [Methanimicrococcus sp.]